MLENCLKKLKMQNKIIKETEWCSIDIGEFNLSLNKAHLQNKLSQEEKHGTKNIV